MKFINSWLNKTALYLAIEKENIEIIKLLLSNGKIDVNAPNIINLFYMKFKIIYINRIKNHIIL